MNNEGVRNIQTVLGVVVIFVVAIGIIFFILNNNKVENKVVDKPQVTTKVKADDYSVSLSELIKDVDFSKNNEYEIKHKGTTYYFKCRSYNNESKTCTDGSGLLDVEDSLYTLFSIDNNSYNYFTNNSNYNIVVNRSNVFLYSSIENVGTLRIFDRQGNLLNLVEDIIDSNITSGESWKPIITYYNVNFKKCNNGEIFNYSIDLKNPILLHKNELLEGLTCN